MTPDTLRRAATLIRERAEKATPGPWGWTWFDGTHAAREVTYAVAPAVARTNRWKTGFDNAEHIASWHPAVALAAATWLEHEADRAEHQPWTDDVTEQALAFATAYLGEEME
jgi:hypothetical protein